MPRPFLETQAALLRRRPLVVGTLTGRSDLRGQLARAASPLVDLVELRLDTFPSLYTAGAGEFSVALMQRVCRTTRKPVLLTFRSPGERGAPVRPGERIGDASREAIVAPLLPMAALVDVEVRRPTYARRLSAVARRMGVGVIQSYHDFKGARLSGLDRWAARARATGADIFKVAVTPRQDGDLDAFLKWGLALKGPRILIGMGPAAAMTRTVGFTFGSLLTYGHLGLSAAPGQIGAVELGRRVRAIYSGGGRGK